MARKNRRRIGRRKVLQVSGTALAGFAGVSAASAGPTRSNPEVGTPEDPNIARFSDKGTVGYAKGTYDQPVTPSTIRKLQETVLQNRPDARDVQGAMIDDPTATPADEYRGRGAKKHVVGYGIKWLDNSPHITISYAPQLQPMDVQVRDEIERNAYAEIDEFVNGGRK